MDKAAGVAEACKQKNVRLIALCLGGDEPSQASMAKLATAAAGQAEPFSYTRLDGWLQNAPSLPEPAEEPQTAPAATSP